MKKVLLIFFSILLLFCFTSCKKTEAGDLYEYTVNDVDDLVFSVKDGTLSKTGATVVIENNTNITYYYGTPFFIQVKMDDGWHGLKYINDEISWTMPLLMTGSGETDETEISWKHMYGSLDKGQYRIVKRVSSSERVDDDSIAAHYIAAEFEIER